MYRGEVSDVLWVLRISAGLRVSPTSAVCPCAQQIFCAFVYLSVLFSAY
jgi:hypothetical protein